MYIDIRKSNLEGINKFIRNQHYMNENWNLKRKDEKTSKLITNLQTNKKVHGCLCGVINGLTSAQHYKTRHLTDISTLLVKKDKKKKQSKTES